MSPYLRLGHLRLAGFDLMLAIAVIAALAMLTCWLFVYQALYDRRHAGRTDTRISPLRTWNPVAWLGGGTVGLLIGLQFFLTRVWPWSRLHWLEEWTPVLFVAACLGVVVGAAAIAFLIGSVVSYILYPVQVMVLAVVQAGDWHDRLLLVLADVFIVVCASLAILAASRVRFF